MTKQPIITISLRFIDESGDWQANGLLLSDEIFLQKILQANLAGRAEKISYDAARTIIKMAEGRSSEDTFEIQQDIIMT